MTNDFLYIDKIDFQEAWEKYTLLKEIWPSKTHEQKNSKKIDHILDLSDDFDIFIFDGYGVLNNGVGVIRGMPEVIRKLSEQKKSVYVLTNGASFDVWHSIKKYDDFGYSFSPKQVISSRDVMVDYLTDKSNQVKKWGVIATNGSEVEKLADTQVIAIQDQPELVDDVDGVIILATQQWTVKKNNVVLKSLKECPRPVLIANSDVCAPFKGWFSTEPSYYAYYIWQETGIIPTFFGKPFHVTYEYLKRKLEADSIEFDPKRALMVGDTPQTDILGANNVGMSSLLMTKHGLFAEESYDNYVKECGIYPDYIWSM